MATHSNILARRIPWTEEPVGLHTVHGVANSWTRLRDEHFHFFTIHDCLVCKWLARFFCSPSYITSSGRAEIFAYSRNSNNCWTELCFFTFFTFLTTARLKPRWTDIFVSKIKRMKSVLKFSEGRGHQERWSVWDLTYLHDNRLGCRSCPDAGRRPGANKPLERLHVCISSSSPKSNGMMQKGPSVCLSVQWIALQRESLS